VVNGAAVELNRESHDVARGPLGYASGSVTENAGFGGLVSAISWAMGTMNHRLHLIHPNAVDLGTSSNCAAPASAHSGSASEAMNAESEAIACLRPIILSAMQEDGP
jgi:hypothetical protein